MTESRAAILASSTELVASRTLSRQASIDILRGLTMALMIFVNDLASVKGLPWWNYHMPAKANGMTYVDMVFPLFLFVMGVSLPLAFDHRLQRNRSLPALWKHILLRTAGLLGLGIVLANASKADQQRMGIAGSTWALLALLGAVLFYNVYPRGEGTSRTIFRSLRWIGLALFVLSLLIFRRTTHSGQVTWLDISYWEILGLIGWTYLSISLLYLATRRLRYGTGLCFLLSAILNVLCATGNLQMLQHLPLYIWPFGNGAFPLIASGGLVTSQILFGNRTSPESRMRLPNAIAFACLNFVLGWLTMPLGISKIRATPTWCFYSIGTGVLALLLLHLLCDLKGRCLWAKPVAPAGSNTLLTYLLPDFYYFAFGASGLAAIANSGIAGTIRALIFTAIILALSYLLTRIGVRLQL